MSRSSSASSLSSSQSSRSSVTCRQLTLTVRNQQLVLLLATHHLLLFYSFSTTKERRKNAVPHRRLDWDFHGSTLIQESQFRRYYCMHAASFEQLLSFIAPIIVCKDPVRSTARTGIPPVTPANKLQMSLSWLAGGKSYCSLHCSLIYHF